MTWRANGAHGDRTEAFLGFSQLNSPLSNPTAVDGDVCDDLKEQQLKTPLTI